MSEQMIVVQLERDRLEHRLRRIEMVTRALRERALHRDAELGTTPAPLREAIATFEIERDEIQRRLRCLR